MPSQRVSSNALTQLILHSPLLETLHISPYCYINSLLEMQQLAEALRGHAHLQKLSLTNMACSPPPVPSGRGVERFYLTWYPCIDPLLDSLTTIPHLAHVRLHETWRITPLPVVAPPSDCSRGIQDTSIWSRLVQMPHLQTQTLSLRDWNLTDQDLVSLAEAFSLASSPQHHLPSPDRTTGHACSTSRLETSDIMSIFNFHIGHQGLEALLEILQTNVVLKHVHWCFCRGQNPNEEDPSFRALEEQVKWLLLLNRTSRSFLSASRPSLSSHPEGWLREFVQILLRADDQLNVLYYFCRNCPQFFNSTTIA